MAAAQSEIAHSAVQGRKRKDVSNDSAAPRANKKPRFAAAKDARVVASQISSKAYKSGELNIKQFVQARQFEIQALEQGLVNSKKALTKRAFQLVPKELRRRTASHNAKRVPKRLRDRARREMKEDNTPTVTARRREPSTRMRIRIETAKKLRSLGSKRRMLADAAIATREPVKTRPARVKSARLADPPVPKAKFKKGQLDKTWLPTHLYHAKRARMTPPKEPLWRFALPLTPTAKSYRSTHRAVTERGCIAFDMSYTSTIMLSGRYRSLLGILHALDREDAINKLRTARKWAFIKGESAVDVNLYQRDAPYALMAPVTVIWRTTAEAAKADTINSLDGLRTSVIFRVHPSAFHEVWHELVKISKTVKPAVTVEDIRYEIGSIDVVGPASTEALLSVLNPYDSSMEPCLKQLLGLTSTSLLPAGTVLDVEVKDPRLCAEKIRSAKQRTTDDVPASHLANWSPPSATRHGYLFDKRNRTAASSALPSQKAIQRRRALAAPGQDPIASDKDPRIPILAFTSSAYRSTSSSWTLLLPWKCVLPLWYTVMYLPLSTGLQPRLGGLDEIRELALEHNTPWFPGDYPTTKAGWTWELAERRRLFTDWKKRPKSKRVNWDSLDLGGGRKGEVGSGWACDWSRVLNGTPTSNALSATSPPSGSIADGKATAKTDGDKQAQETGGNKQAQEPTLEAIAAEVMPSFHHSVPSNVQAPSPPTPALRRVRITQITRGISSQCARIYRLPPTGGLRKCWLAVHPKYAKGPRNLKQMRKLPADVPSHAAKYHLARSLLEAPQPGQPLWPSCPAEEHLIGFVTSGNYDLGAGRGTAIGSILASAALEEQPLELRGLCIVRNSGQEIGRLAEWTLL